MTQLLISVRNRVEAELALVGGAEMIDVKEPTSGSLGAASKRSVTEIHRWMSECAPQIPVSMACGELLDVLKSEDPRSPVPQFDLPSGLSFAKIGMQGVLAATSESRWRKRLREIWQSFPHGTRPVAVMYADHASCQSPFIDDVIELAVLGEAPYVLIDTWDKRRGMLFQVQSPDVVTRWCAKIREAKCQPVLAGSLTVDSLPVLRDMSPEIVAIRGAACAGSRIDTICPDRVRQFRDAMERLGM